MVLGLIVDIITFPGVVAHEYAHALACKAVGIQVHKIEYFNIDPTGPRGYVIHAEPTKLLQGFVISFFPLIFSLGVCFGLGVALGFALHGGWGKPFSNLVAWLGISTGMHSAPSQKDAENFAELANKLNSNILVKAVAYPLITICGIWEILSAFWLDYFLGILVFYLAVNLMGAQLTF